MMFAGLMAIRTSEARHQARRAEVDALSAPGWALLVRYGTANQVAHAPGMIRRYGPLVDAGPGWLAFQQRRRFGRSRIVRVPCP